MKYFIPTILLILFPMLCYSQGYELNGNAIALEDDCYQLTAATQTQNGTVWYDDQLNLQESFEIEFLMNLGSIDAQGADGIVFCMQTVGTNALGLTGGGMGFSGFDPSFGIEFDTWQNNNFSDPFEDHIAFQIDGNVDHLLPDAIAGPVSMDPGGANTEDGLDHSVKVSWDATSNTIAVYFDCELRLEHSIDIAEEVFDGESEVWWGFTSGTGAAVNQQVVCLQENILNVNPTVTICEGGEVQLQASGSIAGDYSWSPAEGLNDPDVADPIASPTETTTYYVTSTDFCGFEQTDSTVVIVETLSASIGEDYLGCFGESYTLDASETEGSYLWSNESTESSITVTESGLYSVTITGGECVAVAEASVEFAPELSVDLGEDVAICEGESILLEAIASNADFYTWTGGSEESSLQVSEEGVYTLTVAQEGVDCTASDEILVEVLTSAEPDLGEDISICSGESVVISSQYDEGVVWQDGSTEPDFVVTESGTYTITVGEGGCAGSDEIVVSLGQLPDPELDRYIYICEEIFEDYLLYVEEAAGVSYEWQDGSTESSYLAQSDGMYILHSSINTCSRVDTVEVIFYECTVLPIELISFKGQAFEGKNILEWTTYNGDSPAQYILQASPDGREFKNIYAIQSEELNGLVQFQYEDLAAEGLHYYRLKYGDAAMPIKYSRVISIEPRQAVDFDLYPNPAEDFLTLNFDESAAKTSISIYDCKGRLVLQESVYSGLRFSIAELTPGIYFLEAESNGIRYKTRWIKQ